MLKGGPESNPHGKGGKLTAGRQETTLTLAQDGSWPLQTAHPFSPLNS